MLRLKSLVAACVLSLSVGAANADTFYINGEFDNFAGHINPFCTGCPIDMSKFPLPYPVSGSLSFANDGTLTSLNLVVQASAMAATVLEATRPPAPLQITKIGQLPLTRATTVTLIPPASINST